MVYVGVVKSAARPDTAGAGGSKARCIFYDQLTAKVIAILPLLAQDLFFGRPWSSVDDFRTAISIRRAKCIEEHSLRWSKGCVLGIFPL